jgi:hypothetical protein
MKANVIPKQPLEYKPFATGMSRQTVDAHRWRQTVPRIGFRSRKFKPKLPSIMMIMIMTVICGDKIFT